MLQNTFLHIPGIGETLERRLWHSGIIGWDSIHEHRQLNIPPKKMERITQFRRESLHHLIKGNPRYFTDLLPAKEHWRIFPEFRNSTAYIDIETTGLELWGSEITTIALYDGKKIKYYVHGKNLEDFLADIQAYNVLVTYNGKVFDIPFIEKQFRTKMRHAHIDLRYVLKSLGYTGGLKMCEKNLGINRGGLDGVDGYFAVLLWQEYQKNNNEKALETLLAYNIEDVVNLEILMVMAYNMKIKDTPFVESHQLPVPIAPQLPFKPDLMTVDRIRRTIFSASEYYYVK